MKKSWDNWELLAIEYLKKNGYHLIDTNFKFSIFWEIDLILKKDEITVFVEVKYRSNDKFWTWTESIWASKKRKILKTIEYYSVKNKINLEKIRFDVISIEKMEKSFRLTHFRNESL
jgi:putative endonuclease